MQVIPWSAWAKLMRPGVLGWFRRVWWHVRGGTMLPAIEGGSGAGWTPVNLDPITANTAYATPFFAGVIIATNGTASTTHLRQGQTVAAGTILATYIIPAVTGGETRSFPTPGLAVIQGGFNLQLDANVTRCTVLRG